jgi:hypothetical protein
MFHLLILHKVMMVIETTAIETEAAEEPVKLEFIQVVSVELEQRVQ